MKTTLYQHTDGHTISYDPLTIMLECHNGKVPKTVNIPICHCRLTVLGKAMTELGNELNKNAKAISRIKPLLAEMGYEMRRSICKFDDPNFKITYFYNEGLVEFVDNFNEDVARIHITPDALIALGKVIIAVGSVLMGGTE